MDKLRNIIIVNDLLNAAIVRQNTCKIAGIAVIGETPVSIVYNGADYILNFFEVLRRAIEAIRCKL